MKPPEPTRIAVLGDRPYDVYIGAGLDPLLAPLLAGAHQVLVVHPPGATAAADRAVAALARGDRQVHQVSVPDGEAQKDLAVATGLWAQLGAAGFTRTDALVAVGGGATTDLAGFVAATWLRGVPVVHVPTTLLGMVDAAIGGKTGINTAAGKNLVGSFHPPAGVLCDLGHLSTLPTRDLAAGLAEVVKVGFTHDPAILDLIEADPAEAIRPDGSALRELVERAIRVKATVVAGDLTDRGGREMLNYGHTLGHAIEQVAGYTWRHGDAVSVGLVFAAELSRRAAGLAPATADRHRQILDRLGLPTRYVGEWEPLSAAMVVDKKSRAGQLRFVVLDALAAPRILPGPSAADLAAAFRAVQAPETGVPR